MDSIETKQDIVMLINALVKARIRSCRAGEQSGEGLWRRGDEGSKSGGVQEAGSEGSGGISYLQLVHQHRDGVELVIGVLRVRHNERGRWVRV